MSAAKVAALRWMPAKSYGHAFAEGRPVGVAVHCTESDNGAGTAESLAGPGWFGGPAGTSAHKMFDRDSGVEMVRRSRVAYHAGPKGNVCAVSYEFCGKAGWSREKWHAPEQLRMLDLAAPHIADDLRAVGAPARWLSLAQLATAARTGDPGNGGLFTHNDIRLALGGTTHTDPGKNFPYAYLLERVRAELTGTTTTTPEEGFLMALSDDQQAEVLTLLREQRSVAREEINGALDAHLRDVNGALERLVAGDADQIGKLDKALVQGRFTDNRLAVGLRDAAARRVTPEQVREIVGDVPQATVQALVALFVGALDGAVKDVEAEA